MRISDIIGTCSERTARLFAADCAEHVLDIFERVQPGDDRPRRAIKAARAFADGRIGAEDLAAARLAARAAWADIAFDARHAAAAHAARAAAWAAASDIVEAGAVNAAHDAAETRAAEARADAEWWQLYKLSQLIKAGLA